MDLDLSLGNISLTDETYIADTTLYPEYQYKSIMGHVAENNNNKNKATASMSQMPSLKKGSSLAPIVMNSSLKKTRDPLVTFKLHLFSDVEINYPGYPIKIELGLKGMRFVFLNRFVDELIKWLMNSALLKIPKLITDTMDKSELMAGNKDEENAFRVTFFPAQARLCL